MLGLELMFGPLALLPRSRPWLWMAIVAMHLGLVLVVDFADLSLGMLVFQAFALDPAWVRPSMTGPADVLFFDGTCRLCHGAVRFVLAEDRTATAYVFAPLGGERFRAAFPSGAGLPDSIVILTTEGEVLVRSAAVLHVLRRLGGLWRVIAAVVAVVPRVVRDAGYDACARTRHRILGRRSAACPLIPPDLQSRFVP